MKPEALSKEDFVAFLYLLMRDATPTGEVVRIVRMIKPGTSHAYTSPELETYARRLAGELLS